MRVFSAGAAVIAALALATMPAGLAAQAAPSTPASQSSAAPAAPQSETSGKVILSRSIDENGETTTHAAPAVITPAEGKAVDAPIVDDAERRAVTFTSLDLDVHLRPADQLIAVRALLTMRNDGKAPLTHLPLQISSTLRWERIRVDGRDAAFTVATLNSDTDHTGQLHEAAIALASPLAPDSSVRLDVTYSGAIAADAKRLTAIGTPDDAALHSDWDEIGVPFTGLRGFGNVVWYPVSSVPVILGDGARVFDEIGQHKLRLTGAHVRLRLAAEYPAGQAPTVALIDGRSVALAVTNSAEGQEVPSTATASLETTLGFEAPSLFVATRTEHSGANANVYALPEDVAAADAWTSAATAVTPFLQGWLGERPQQHLTLLDLPDAHDAPFETGAMLAVPIRPGPPEDLQGVLVHALTHTFLGSGPRPAWLDEGVANFMGTLWTEKQQGREKALETLEANRPGLAMAEPESPGDSVGQPLNRAYAPVYYRTKATYVLWMLRDMAGDQALSAALRAYASEADANTAKTSSPGKDAQASSVNVAGVKPFAALLTQAGAESDLKWFFADWVDADKGLPDLSIDGVFPNSATRDSSLVAVNLANNGYAAAEVPLTVRSDLTSITQRVIIPARSKLSQRILIQGKPVEVQLNDGSVPETQASVHVTKLD
jgi:hypothetical protein